MAFNFFSHRKDIHKEEIDKKYKIAVTPNEQLQSNSLFNDDIDIILGENIKKSKFTQAMDNPYVKD